MTRSRTTSGSSSRRRPSSRSTRSCSPRSSASRSASGAGLRRNRPTDHALRVASLAGISMPTFWIALVVLYVGFYRLGWFPGGQRLDPGTSPPSERHRPLHRRRAPRREPRPLRAGVPPPPAAGARARRVQRQPAHTLHALGRARGDRQRLRARRARQGDAGAGRRPPLHPAGGAAVGGHRARPRLRERAHGRGARREDLLLARRRPVRLRGRRQPRRARDRRRQPLRRGGLRHRQLHRRHPLRRSSIRGSGSRDAPITLRGRVAGRTRRIHPGLRQPLAVVGVGDRDRLGAGRGLRAADRALRTRSPRRSRPAPGPPGSTSSAPTSSAATSSAA